MQAIRTIRAHPWWPRALGLIAVMLFAMTLPMTRLANGSVAEPQWPPLFVAAARAALAGCLALVHLRWVRAAWPSRVQRRWLMGVILGGVLGFPLGMGWAVRVVPASHAAVLTGLLPPATAALAAWWLGHRPRMGFWLASAVGAGLMAAFVLSGSLAGVDAQATRQVDLRALAPSRMQVLWADACLLAAMLCAAVAYVAGARLARDMPSAQVMSWALVLAWPLTLALSWWAWPADLVDLPSAWQRIGPSAWAGLLYVAVCSTWLGFFFWYAALARDAMRVSQLQLFQPFMAIGVSAWVLGEAVPAQTWFFAFAVLATVGIGQHLAGRPLRTASPSSLASA